MKCVGGLAQEMKAQNKKELEEAIQEAKMHEKLQHVHIIRCVFCFSASSPVRVHPKKGCAAALTAAGCRGVGCVLQVSRGPAKRHTHGIPGDGLCSRGRPAGQNHAPQDG